MANYFVIGADEKEYGPVPAEELRKWVTEGRADAHTRVRAEGATDWLALSQLPEFADAPAKRTSLPPPPARPLAPVGKTSIMAIAALVLGICGIFTCGITALFGLILGIIAMVRVTNSRGALTGKGLALGGVIVSGIMLILLPVMAAMLLPALAAAKQKAMQIACVNNEKQLALAVTVYANEHANHLPPAATWCDAIHSAVGNDQVFKCVAATDFLTSRCGYAFNARLDGLDTHAVNPQTVLLFESDKGWNANGGPELEVARHRNHSIVVAFADGSVQIMPESRLSSLRWEP